MSEKQHFDVVICGGGIAGLTLARQLRRDVPEATIAVVERSCRPLREGCHKVGESSVELQSHYLAERLGLKSYLDTEHLHKNGLRFFTGDTSGPLADRPEIGPAEFPIVPSYQLDRGKIESDLRQWISDDGATLLEGRSVKDFALADDGSAHSVTLDDGQMLSARWLVDASGRARLISKRLGLRAESPNSSSSAWFRVKGQLRVGELVPESETAWHTRDLSGTRWQSTVHLMGQGYWVWIIVLATGHTSIGIVADGEHHPFNTFNREDRANEWLAKHEPVLASYIEDRPREDFRVMHNYSYLSTKAFDSDVRWACVGEAALFVDPLYSLGGDFIAMLNTYTTRIIREDLAGTSADERRAVTSALNDTVLLLSRDAARTLSHNGKVFPHADVFGAKLWWDFYNYWSFMCAHFFQRIFLADAETLRRFLAMGQSYYDLNTSAQSILEGWADLKNEAGAKKSFVPLPMFPSVLANQHLALLENLDTEQTLAKMATDLETGRQLVTEILAHALRDLGPGHAEELGRRIRASRGLALPIGGRFAADSLPRRERLAELPEIGRDLERALGRKNASVSLEALWKSAEAAT